MTYHSVSAVHGQDKAQNHSQFHESGEHLGPPYGEPKSTRPSTRRPQSFDFVAFHITRELLPRWLQLSEVGRKLHAILVTLPGVFRDGWRGVKRRLRELYREHVGSWLNGARLQAALDELIEAGFLDARQVGRQVMAFTVLAPGRDSSSKEPNPEPEAQATASVVVEAPPAIEAVEVPVEFGTQGTESVEPPAIAMAEAVEVPVEFGTQGTESVEPPAIAMAEAVEVPAAPAVGTDSTPSGYQEYPPFNSVECTVEEATTEPPEPRPVASPAPVPGPAAAVRLSPEGEDLVRAVRERFKFQVGASTIRKLIGETSAENVAAQLNWFGHRDSGWARRGAVAAFVTYVRDEVGEPEVLAAQRREAERRMAREEAEQAEVVREGQTEQDYQRALAALSAEELKRIKAEVRASLGPLFKGETGAAFVGMLRGRVLETAKKTAA